MNPTRKQLPSADNLREMLDYNPQTGAFVWLPRPLSHFPYEGEQRRWNGRFAGTLAGRTDARGYRTIGITIQGKGCTTYRANRLAWLIVHGAPVPHTIDHIDGDKANDRISNLRAATTSQNMCNAARMLTNTSGAKGVFVERDGRFRARVGLRGKTYDFGRFATLAEAIEARRKGAEKLQGAFARHE